MTGIIIIIVLLLMVIFIVWLNNHKKKRQEELRQKRLLEKQEEEVRIRQRAIEEAEQKEKQEAELKRLEEQKYETVEVVFATVKESGKPTAILKRNNNTYSFVERPSNPFVINSSLKLLNETIEKLKWVNEDEYKRREELEKQEEARLIEKREELQRHSDFLNSFGINYLFHMTHKNNLENILHNGLQSHNFARNNQLTQVDIADDRVNVRRHRNEPVYNKSIHDYVPLYFNPKNPMLYVRRGIQNDIIIIAVDKMMLYNENSLFTDGNAASDHTSFFNNIENLNTLNWQCINAAYWTDINDGRRIRCSEILIYGSIPTGYIQKIFCNNTDTKQFVETKLTNYPTIETEVNTNLYFSGTNNQRIGTIL
jgi:hypothetical protein